MAECSFSDDAISDSASETTQDAPESTLYRRLSGVAYGAARPKFNDLSADPGFLFASERARSRGAERNLLRDNHIRLEPPQPSNSRLYRRIFSGSGADGKLAGEREAEPLLAGGVAYDDDEVNQQWNEAVAAGRARTS